MGSPEATLAAADAVGTPEGAFEELTGSLQGWKRKVRRELQTLSFCGIFLVKFAV